MLGVLHFIWRPYRDWVLLLQSVCLCSSLSCLTPSSAPLAKTRKKFIDLNTLLPTHLSWPEKYPGGHPMWGVCPELVYPSTSTLHTQSSLAEAQPTAGHAHFFLSVIDSSLLDPEHRQPCPSQSGPGHTWSWSQNVRAGKTHGDCFTSEETEDLIDQKKKKKLPVQSHTFNQGLALGFFYRGWLCLATLQDQVSTFLLTSTMWALLPFSDGDDDNNHASSLFLQFSALYI